METPSPQPPIPQKNQQSEAPPKFSWCVEGLLSACAFPRSKDHLQFLVDNGISCLVSLTEERRVDLHGVDIDVVYIPVVDNNIPTMEQVDQFLDVVKSSKQAGKGVTVHCAGGKGRTGTMLACYFVREDKMTPSDAVDHVRALRSGSIETADQELFIYQIASIKSRAEMENGRNE